MEKSAQLFEEIKEKLSQACDQAGVPAKRVREGSVESSREDSTGAKLGRRDISLEHPPAHLAQRFDLSSNLPFLLAKQFGLGSPLGLAQEICRKLKESAEPWLEAVEPLAPGYVNLRLSRAALGGILDRVFQDAQAYPSDMDWSCYAPSSVFLEYCSANPTGPPHFGHARGAVLGDTLARLMRHAGIRVHREFYVNDVGGQIEKLGASLQARFRQEALGERDFPFPQDGYPGEYLAALARRLPKEAASWSQGQFADFGKRELSGLIERDLETLKVSFDSYFYESELHKAGLVDAAIQDLTKQGRAIEQEGAVVFISKGLSEEDKERVLKRSNGQSTYFAADIAYHRKKFEKGFERYINIWGADHHGYVPRIQLALEALGLSSHKLGVILIQMVRLLREGKPVVLSKRAGDYQPLGEIASEVGVDALRYFLNSRTPSAQLDFDLDLAKKKTPENPVYLIQYAHARIHSIDRQKKARGVVWKEESAPAPAAIPVIEGDPQTREMLINLAFFSEALIRSVFYLSAHHLTHYLCELARTFHHYYETHPILAEPDSGLAWSRWRICQATRQVLLIGLDLLGISAPERM